MPSVSRVWTLVDWCGVLFFFKTDNSIPVLKIFQAKGSSHPSNGIVSNGPTCTLRFCDLWCYCRELRGVPEVDIQINPWKQGWAFCSTIQHKTIFRFLMVVGPLSGVRCTQSLPHPYKHQPRPPFSQLTDRACPVHLLLLRMADNSNATSPWTTHTPFFIPAITASGSTYSGRYSPVWKNTPLFPLSLSSGKSHVSIFNDFYQTIVHLPHMVRLAICQGYVETKHAVWGRITKWHNCHVIFKFYFVQLEKMC